MGPAAILELTLLPRLWQDLPTIFDKNILMGGSCGDMTMSHAAFGWDPSNMLHLLPEEENERDGSEDTNSSDESVLQSLEGKERNEALKTHFQNSVGGLQPQIDAIVRRVLDGRSIYATQTKVGKDTSMTNQARIEAEELSLLGLQPVRGLLLYGRPGEALVHSLLQHCKVTIADIYFTLSRCWQDPHCQGNSKVANECSTKNSFCL